MVARWRSQSFLHLAPPEQLQREVGVRTGAEVTFTQITAVDEDLPKFVALTSAGPDSGLVDETVSSKAAGTVAVGGSFARLGASSPRNDGR